MMPDAIVEDAPVEHWQYARYQVRLVPTSAELVDGTDPTPRFVYFNDLEAALVHAQRKAGPDGRVENTATHQEQHDDQN